MIVEQLIYKLQKLPPNVIVRLGDNFDSCEAGEVGYAEPEAYFSEEEFAELSDYDKQPYVYII